MKDYSVLEGLDRNIINELRCAYDRGYRHGRDDEWAATQAKLKEEEGYKRGLESAWSCAIRIMTMPLSDQEKIFNMQDERAIMDAHSAEEAIDIFKRYDEKQNCIVRCCKNCKHSEKGMVGSTERCESCYYDGVSKGNTLFEPMEKDNSKIEVGDEVKRADIDKSLVIIKFTEEGWALGMNEEGNISDVKLSVYKKTGKHFDQIVEVFNSLKGDIDA